MRKEERRQIRQGKVPEFYGSESRFARISSTVLQRIFWDEIHFKVPVLNIFID